MVNINPPEITDEPVVERPWISIEKKLPKVRADFKTMMETQQISKPLWIKLKEGLFKQKEIDGYYVVLNGEKLWSLDPCGTSQYYKLEIGTHWCEK